MCSYSYSYFFFDGIPIAAPWLYRWVFFFQSLPFKTEMVKAVVFEAIKK